MDAYYPLAFPLHQWRLLGRKVPGPQKEIGREGDNPQSCQELQQPRKPQSPSIRTLAPGRACGCVERGTHTGAGLLARLMTPWKTHVGMPFFCSWRKAPFGKDHTSAVKNCALCRKNPCWEKFSPSVKKKKGGGEFLCGIYTMSCLGKSALFLNPHWSPSLE